MTNRISSSAALAYRGTQATNPPNWLVHKRDPASSDTHNVSLGDMWLNQLTREAWILVSLAGNNTNHGKLIAVWLQIAKNTFATMTGNTGGPIPPDSDDNINLIGDGTTVSVVGNPGAHELTFSLTGTLFGQSFTGNSGGAVSPNPAGNINLVGDGNTMIFTGTPGTNTITASIINPLDLTFTGNTGGAITPDLFGNFNLVGDGIGVQVAGNPGTSTLTMSLNGDLDPTTLTGDTGGPIASGMGNNINLIGGSGILTEGQTGDNLIVITQASSLATTYETDLGTALPAGNVLAINGGSDIGTTGAGSTVTANLDGSLSGITNLTVSNLTINTSATLGYLTEGVVQTNNTGIVTSTEGTDGQVLISSTAGDPAWANITAGANIAIINGPNSITVSRSAAGGNGWVLIGTINNYSGTFTTGITPAYRTLAIVIHRAAIATSPVSHIPLWLQISDNGGASYYTTNYVSGATFTSVNNAAPDVPFISTSTNAFVMNEFYRINVYAYASGVVYLYNVNSTTSPILMNGTGISSTAGALRQRYVTACGAYNGPLNGPVNALRITANGPITTPLPPSTISLYGLTY